MTFEVHAANTDIKVDLVSFQMEMNVTGNWWKGNPCHRMTEYLTNVLWKVELTIDKMGYLIEETSKQNVKESAQVLENAYDKL